MTDNNRKRREKRIRRGGGGGWVGDNNKSKENYAYKRGNQGKVEISKKVFLQLVTIFE